MNIIKLIRLFGLFVCVAFIHGNLRAETLYIYNEDFIILGAPSGADLISLRWGIWDGSQFVQSVFGGTNSGYADLTIGELEVSLNQVNNTTYSVGTQMAVAFFSDGSADASALDWSGSVTHWAVLTDPSWLAPVFTNSPSFVTYDLTVDTTALAGSYSWNAGDPQITLVPEPSTYAAIFGVLALALVAYRRRRA